MTLNMIPILKIYAATVILHTLCVFGVIIVPDLPPKQYVTEGDLKLGGIFPISGYSGSGPCGPEIRNTGILQYIEAMVFAVKEINNRSDILPNVTLGFAILDSCLKPTTALVQALHFVPRQQMAPHKNPTARAQNGGYNEIEGEATNAYRDHFEVEGVIGAMLSANSIEVANILTPFYVPQISYASTSDILSDKSTYKYFLRLAPPDRFQTQAMIDLHRHFDWSYSSLLYLEGAYGEGGAKAFRELAKSAGICIAVDAMIKEVMSEAEYDDVISNLVANQKARVVILYVGARHVRQVFLSVRRLNATGKFIWIGSDSWASRLSQINGLEDVLLGALTFKVHASYVPAAHDYFQTLNLDNNLANPWFVQFWEKYFQCSLKDNATNPCKPNLAISNSKHFKPSSSIAPVVDSVYTFGYALHRMRNDLCPLATGAALRECIEGRELLKYLKKSVFVGNNGEVIFNENGDVLGRYDIQQSQRINGVYRQTDVGFWDAKIPGLVLRQDVVNWNTSFAEVGAGVPESVCSKPCKAGEYRVQLELKCCWECRKCFKNEISSANDTRCTVCPEFTWPNKTSPNTCVTIKPTFMNWQDPLCIALVCFSLVGVSCTASIAVFYLKNSHTRLIKASSRELSYIMLIGTVLCYLTVFTFVGKPEESVCKAAYFGFGLSFTWIYGPLMVKTNRIYRIFKSGRTSNVLPPLVSPRSQVLIAGVVISIQVVLSLAMFAVFPAGVKLVMPVRSEDFVELTCYLPPYNVIALLSFNMVLLFLCTVHAVKTRKLPDNFNESRYISLCVYTTLVIWLAFIPTYFTTERAYYKLLLLFLALLLNCTVSLVSLFLPKVYALLYVEDEDALRIPDGVGIGVAATTTGGVRSHTHATTSRVTPVQVQGVPQIASKSG